MRPPTDQRRSPQDVPCWHKFRGLATLSALHTRKDQAIVVEGFVGHQHWKDVSGSSCMVLYSEKHILSSFVHRIWKAADREA